MKINSLKAENFMKLNVEVHMEGHDVVITGKNETGKSTFINAIWYALTGKDIPAEPIQKGRESASIEVTVDRPGEQPLIVIRRFKRDGKDSLTVKTPDGAKYPTPQAFLNSIIGEISFDPFDFVQEQPANQKKQLQKVLGIDTTELEKTKKITLNEKQAHENLLTSLKTELEKLPAFDQILQERSLDELQAEQQKITDAHQQRSAHQDAINADTTVRGQRVAQATQTQIRIKQVEEGINRLDDQLVSAKAELEWTQQEYLLHNQVAEALQSQIEHRIKQRDQVVIPPDEGVKAKAQEIAIHNENVKQQRSRFELEKKLQAAQDLIGKFKDTLDEIERNRIELIQSVKMPVPGLDFSDDGLTFDGLPFGKEQFSTARMNVIGFQITMAMNPNLKILRVKDWVLLDSDTKAQVKELAKDHGFQLFIEMVNDDKEIGFQILE